MRDRAAAAASTATGLFLYDLTDESSIINACSILGTPPDLVLVASGLLHDQSGAVMPEKTLRAIQPEAMARMFAVNTIGPALIAKHWLPRLPKDRRAVFAVLSARGFNWRQPAGGMAWLSRQQSRAQHADCQFRHRDAADASPWRSSSRCIPAPWPPAFPDHSSQV
jgi:NAD(P)-dependent dehydrogenase (short-subunit alcohol dehydrogenase family)